MKVLILFGLIAVAAAYPTSIQQRYGPGRDCVIIEYDLGYTKIEFEACDRPRDCLQGIAICPSNCQLTAIGAAQFIILGSPPNFDFYNIQLFGGTCSGISDSFCLKADPRLWNCREYHELEAALEEQTTEEPTEEPEMFCTQPAEGGPKMCKPLTPPEQSAQY